MSTTYPTASDEERETAIEAAAQAVQRGGLVVLPDRHRLRHRRRRVRPRRGAGAARRQGPRPRDAAAGADQRRDHARRARHQRPAVRRRALTEAFWPGPLTLVCEQQPSLTWDLGETRGTVAVRMPDHEIALALLERTGPLAVSSANLSGLPAATEAAAAEAMLGDSVEVVLDGGPSPGGGLDHPRRAAVPAAAAPRSARCRSSALNDVIQPLGVHGRRRRRADEAAGCVREYLLVFLVAAAATYLLTVIAREIALRTGAVARVRDRDVHAEPIAVPRWARDARRPGRGVPRGPPAAVPLAQPAVRLPRRPHRADRRRDDLRRSAPSTTSSSSTR